MNEKSSLFSVDTQLDDDLPDDVLYVFGTPQEAIPGHPVPYSATEEESGIYRLLDAAGKQMLRIFISCPSDKEVMEARLAKINGHKPPA